VIVAANDVRDVHVDALTSGAQVSMGPVSLEDIFLQIVGRRIDEDDPLPEAA
jgi:hypothetical protein